MLTNRLLSFLYLLPQTPEHNGAAEIELREIKCGSNLGKGRWLGGVDEANDEFVKTIKRLNESRLRASLNYDTASDVDQKLTWVYPQDTRDRLYAECSDEIKCVGKSGLGKRRDYFGNSLSKGFFINS